MYILVVPSLSKKFIKKATIISENSQFLGTTFDMLFEIAKSFEIAIILGKTAILPKNS